jgi:hypothetical protein
MDTSVLHPHLDQALCNMYEVASSPARRQSSSSLRRIRYHLTDKVVHTLIMIVMKFLNKRLTKCT